MRWDALFADMEMQLAAAEGYGRAQEVADLTRAERATVLLCDRLRGGQGAAVELGLRCGETVRGLVRDVGPAWVLVEDGDREHLVPSGSLAWVRGLAPGAAPPPSSALRRLGIGHALRAVARDREVVRVRTSSGPVVGRVDAVGADHLDVGLATEDTRRPTGEWLAVPFLALEAVSRL